MVADLLRLVARSGFFRQSPGAAEKPGTGSGGRGPYIYHGNQQIQRHARLRQLLPWPGRRRQRRAAPGGPACGLHEDQLKLFNKRERTNDNAVMHAVVEKMTALEMAAVAEYLSGK